MKTILFIGGCADGYHAKDYGDQFTTRQAYSEKAVPLASGDTPTELELIRSSYRRESIVTGSQRVDFFVDCRLSVAEAIVRLIKNYRQQER